MSSYIPVIGLEIHAELLTRSKVFCTCGVDFGGKQNSRCCPVCSGMPGTLPVINQTAVEYAVKAGMALGCDINQFSVFDRKNYFYPDLPKAYQISQLNYPLCEHGSVEIETATGKKSVRIKRIHLEEDAGKLIHDDFNALSLADYNRCGIPLIEIVAEPDIASAEEARAFVEKVSLLLQYAGVSDCRMEQGSLRCDVNISVMKPGDAEYGTRTEIKNLNSLKSIVRAINYEIKRQSQLLDFGKSVVQETRRFNENKGETSSMRTKENAHDYRYFPEPDILQVNFTDEMLAAIQATLPELPNARFVRYTKEYGLSETDANILIHQKVISDFFESAVAVYPNPKSISNFMITELLRRVNLGEVTMDALPFPAEEFAQLVEMADQEKITKNDAKKVLRLMIETGSTPMKIAAEHNMLIRNDTAAAAEIIEAVLVENAAAVAQYQQGESKVYGFLMGQCTKRLRGICTNKATKEILDAKLTALDTAEKSVTENHTETSETVYACTDYVNSAAYYPVEVDGVKKISPENLMAPFDFEAATQQVGETITLRACVHKIRDMSGFSFVILRTGRYLIQALYTESCRDSIAGLREGNFVVVTGKVTQNEKAVGGIELVLSSLNVISHSNQEYPLKVANKKLGCGIEVNLDHRSVSLRNVEERAILKLQEGVANGFRRFMLQEGFTEIHTPKIVAQGAEGGANIFRLEYFDKPAFLNQSPQFYKQAAVAFFDRVFEIAPVYRAEKHATSRHLNEYIGLDFEMGYIDSMYDVMAMETATLRSIMQYLKENYAYEIELLEADIPEVGEIPCVTLLEAKEILGNKGSKNKLDLEPEDEVGLCEYAKEKFGSDFIFVTHFPSSKPPFYAMDNKDDPRLNEKFDLLFRGLEITSGGQRIHDYDTQVAKMKAQGLDPNDFQYYLASHKYGLPPHGGLGIGLERLVMKILRLPNVRQASMFPRDINRLLP